MKKCNRMLLTISHISIGVGFFFLYAYFVRTIFEAHTSFPILSQLEREVLLRKEDALYFSFYKTITDAPDFAQGYQKLMNVTTIEYPKSVNVVHRFHVLPEIAIGYLFHRIKRITHKLGVSPVACCSLDENIMSQPQMIEDILEDPFHFYLEFVWLLGGLTVFIIYMYGSFLSENIFGGIYAVVSYMIFHKNASKIYDRPVARENFAFPFIFWQIFYLCLSIERASRQSVPKGLRLIAILKLTALTSISLLCWQFSSVIFATQIIIMITPWSLGLVSSSFSIDYCISQFLSNLIAYYFSYGNKKYFFAWQNGPIFALFTISLKRMYKYQARPESALKSISLGILLAISSQCTIIDLLEMSGYARSDDNPYTLYRDIVLHWFLKRKFDFTIYLLACSSDFDEKDLGDLWQLLKTIIVKPYCLYGVAVLATFFRKWRIKEPPAISADYVERAKKYVLEDFLEESHVSMKDISNKDTEKELTECLKLLEQCDFDYEKYKIEKTKSKKSSKEHDDFINDIKRLREQINEINEKTRRDAGRVPGHRTKESSDGESGGTVAVDDNVTGAGMSMEAPHVKDDEEQPKCDSFVTNETTPQKIMKLTAATSPAKSRQRESNNNSNNNNNNDGSEQSVFLKYHYLYSFIQFSIFVFIGLSIKKFFFLCYTHGCVIAPAIISKFWHQKQRRIYGTIPLVLFLSGMVNPGFVNLSEEYYPTITRADTLESMLEWINMNTERNAVFAGPMDIIATVHLTTRRPIVNHPHVETRDMRERTEHIYSVFSRQQSSDIYNKCSQLKIQYLIIRFTDCSLGDNGSNSRSSNQCDILNIWDEMQPAYRNYPQFCSELMKKNVPSFFKVYTNDRYGIIKMFSQSLQVNLKHSKMQEKVI